MMFGFFQPPAGAKPARFRCRACEVDWGASEGEFCWACGAPGEPGLVYLGIRPVSEGAAGGG